MDILSYYRALGAGDSSPHGLERPFYPATVKSVMLKREGKINIFFQVGDLFNSGYKSARMKRNQINELNILNDTN